MEKREAIRIDNFKQLYVSIRANIEHSAKELFGIIEEIEKKREELPEISFRIRKETMSLQEVLSRQSEVERQMLASVAVIDKKNDEYEEKVEEIRGAERDIEKADEELERIRSQISIDTESFVKTRASQEEQISRSNSEIGEQQKVIEDEFITYHDTRDKYNALILKHEIEQNAHNKEVVRCKKELAKLNAQIEEKQGALSSFKENVQIFNKELLRKLKDLQIREGRLATLYKEFGIPMRRSDIKKPKLPDIK